MFYIIYRDTVLQSIFTEFTSESMNIFIYILTHADIILDVINISDLHTYCYIDEVKYNSKIYVCKFTRFRIIYNFISVCI